MNFFVGLQKASVGNPYHDHKGKFTSKELAVPANLNQTFTYPEGSTHNGNSLMQSLVAYMQKTKWAGKTQIAQEELWKLLMKHPDWSTEAKTKYLFKMLKERPDFSELAGDGKTVKTNLFGQGLMELIGNHDAKTGSGMEPMVHPAIEAWQKLSTPKVTGQGFTPTSIHSVYLSPAEKANAFKSTAPLLAAAVESNIKDSGGTDSHVEGVLAMAMTNHGTGMSPQMAVETALNSGKKLSVGTQWEHIYADAYDKFNTAVVLPKAAPTPATTSEPGKFKYHYLDENHTVNATMDLINSGYTTAQISGVLDRANDGVKTKLYYNTLEAIRYESIDPNVPEAARNKFADKWAQYEAANGKPQPHAVVTSPNGMSADYGNLYAKDVQDIHTMAGAKGALVGADFLSKANANAVFYTLKGASKESASKKGIQDAILDGYLKIPDSKSMALYNEWDAKNAPVPQAAANNAKPQTQEEKSKALYNAKNAKYPSLTNAAVGAVSIAYHTANPMADPTVAEQDIPAILHHANEIVSAGDDNEHEAVKSGFLNYNPTGSIYHAQDVFTQAYNDKLGGKTAGGPYTSTNAPTTPTSMSGTPVGLASPFDAWTDINTQYQKTWGSSNIGDQAGEYLYDFVKPNTTAQEAYDHVKGKLYAQYNPDKPAGAIYAPKVALALELTAKQLGLDPNKANNSSAAAPATPAQWNPNHVAIDAAAEYKKLAAAAGYSTVTASSDNMVSLIPSVWDPNPTALGINVTANMTSTSDVKKKLIQQAIQNVMTKGPGGTPSSPSAVATNNVVPPSLVQTKPITIEHISDFTEMAPKPGGSQPGAIYVDAQGQKWLIKGNSQVVDGKYDHVEGERRARSEVMTAALMNLINPDSAPEMKLVNLSGKYGGGIGVATKWVDGLVPFNKTNALQKESIQTKMFAPAAWLANWDVIGKSFDNTMFKGGVPFHVDPGAGLYYRAMGEKKDFPADKVVEYETLRDPTKNANAAYVFKGMTQPQMQASFNPIESKATPQAVANLVAAHWAGSGAEKDMVFDTLMKRKEILKNLILTYGQQTSATAPPPTVPKSEIPGPIPGVKEIPQGSSFNDWVHSKWGTPSRPLTGSEKNHLSHYQGSGYRSMNKAVRAGQGVEKDHYDMLKNINSAISTREVPEDVHAYRGVTKDFTHVWPKISSPKDLEGKYIVDAGVPSFSTSRDFAEDWVGVDDGVVLDVVLKKGQKALPIHVHTANDMGEKELLLPSNTYMKVTKVRNAVGKHGRKWYITAEIV